MTILRKRAVRERTLPATALAALLLAGCSSGHVGEDWQCPLAAGGSCASVAAADPAVPKAGAARTMTGGQPIRLLPHEWDKEATRAGPSPARGPGQASSEARSCKADCGFDPFAWLARLFGVDAGGDEREPAAVTSTDIEEVPSLSAAAAGGDVETTNSSSRPASSDPADGKPDGAGDLRTGEAVARIWIAPFVDADGVYREGAWVRVVLEPAAWRLP